jgi:hypothetical protein
MFWSALLVGQFGPCGYAGVAWRECGVVFDQPHGALSVKSLLADGIPACVVAATVAHHIAWLGLKRGVWRLVSEIEEERFAGRTGTVIGQPLDGALCVVVGGEIVGVELISLGDLVAFHHAIGVEVAGFRAEEAVEALEAALHGP